MAVSFLDHNLHMGFIRYQLLLSSKQILLVIAFVCSLVLLSSCATAPAQGRAPLTAAERQFFDRIDPNASVVTKITEEIIEVSNPTYPATGYWRFLGVERFLQVSEAVATYVQKMNMVYDEPAIRYCASLGRYPNETMQELFLSWADTETYLLGEVSGVNVMRFTCQLPNQWALEKIRQGINKCATPAVKFVSRPLQCNNESSYPQSPITREMCSAYNNFTNSMRHSTCEAFILQVTKIEASLIANPATGQALGSVKTMDSAIKECTGLGFIPKTEKHADCVLRLTK
jgi:hypothetical protein